MRRPFVYICSVVSLSYRSEQEGRNRFILPRGREGAKNAEIIVKTWWFAAKKQEAATAALLFQNLARLASTISLEGVFRHELQSGHVAISTGFDFTTCKCNLAAQVQVLGEVIDRVCTHTRGALGHACASECCIVIN